MVHINFSLLDNHKIYMCYDSITIMAHAILIFSTTCTGTIWLEAKWYIYIYIYGIGILLEISLGKLNLNFSWGLSLCISMVILFEMNISNMYEIIQMLNFTYATQINPVKIAQFHCHWCYGPLHCQVNNSHDIGNVRIARSICASTVWRIGVKCKCMLVYFIKTIKIIKIIKKDI